MSNSSTSTKLQKFKNRNQNIQRNSKSNRKLVSFNCDKKREILFINVTNFMGKNRRRLDSHRCSIGHIRYPGLVANKSLLYS